MTDPTTNNSKTFITGSGRAGTSFLVQVLTRLGFDTGFTPGKERYVDAIRAGCERKFEFDLDIEKPQDVVERVRVELPRVLKSPSWGTELKWLMAYGLQVEHVFIPLRDLEDTARSRLSVGLDWMVVDEFEGEERVYDQANIHAMVLGRAIEACVLYNVPCTIMKFPRFIADPEYCYNKLTAWQPIDKEEFMKHHKDLADMDKIQTQ